MAAITIKDMSVSYNKGKTFVLDKLNLNIKDGEFCVFLGPSGCGKSTAMYSIAGLLEPYEGNIYFGDTLMTEMEKGKKKTFIPPQERNIAMVFQEYALYPNMTVRVNMAFALKTKKVPKEEIDRLVMEQATSRSNLASTLMRQYESEGKAELLEEAEKILAESFVLYEKDGGTSFHYGTALITKGDICILRKDYAGAAAAYEAAMENLEKNLNKGQQYQTAKALYEKAKTLAEDSLL